MHLYLALNFNHGPLLNACLATHIILRSRPSTSAQELWVVGFRIYVTSFWFSAMFASLFISYTDTVEPCKCWASVGIPSLSSFFLASL